MQLSAISLAITRLGRVAPAFSPLSLFSSGEAGLWHDPSDMSTMFQDSVGTAPVTAGGQPVGLILDKSKGLVLGPELVTNGDFANGLTGWFYPSGSTLVDGQARIVSTHSSGVGDASNCLSPSPNFSLAGKVYQVEFDATWVSGAFNLQAGQIYVAQLTITPAQNGGVRTRYSYVANRQQSIPCFAIAGVGGEWYIDNISVKELPGNHASQATAAKRPLLKATGICKWNDFDAVDDVLATTFSSSLGSSCTVARANVGSAPTILTGQTIGTTYAQSVDNAGLVIVNRALTTQETSDLTAYLLAKGATS